MSHRVSSELLTYLLMKRCVNISSPKGNTRWNTAAEVMIKKNVSKQGKTDWAHVYMRQTVSLLS